ncbi:MAG: SPFH domain-containing protein [Firmicutes bacterium]|nr:SPFH domain-containing protein [Bacillota bacterium]
MNQINITEKELRPKSGMAALILLMLGILAALALTILGGMSLDTSTTALGIAALVVGIVGICVLPMFMAGLKVVAPNEARVFTLFGRYYGTVKKAGFYYVNPFVSSAGPVTKGVVRTANGFDMKRVVSLKTQTLDNQRQKVNDVLGNPIVIGAVVIWHVDDPTQAVFAVENYREYLGTQTDSTVRNVARLYPYDVFDEGEGDEGAKEKTLRGSSLEIAASMKEELQKRVVNAGLVIEEVRITHLAYAEEIAAAMLQRQQAVAIIAARQKIVDGAVGMVKMAIEKLGEGDAVHMDEARKAAMVSNLLVVLCGNRDAQPIINSGSIDG